MRQQQTFRGFLFILLMLVVLAAVMGLPHGMQADRITNQEFVQILDEGQIVAASIRPSGMFIFSFRNHTPAISHNTNIARAIRSCTLTDVLKIRPRRLLSPVPSAYVMNRDMAEDNEPDKTENMATTPPTTL